MGKPIVHTYEQDKGILKYFPYKAAPCVVTATGVEADANGNKIVPAGTPYPEAGVDCLGFLLHAVDVTQGDAPGSYIYEGTLDPDKIKSSVVTASSLAAVPKVNVFGQPYGASN